METWPKNKNAVTERYFKLMLFNFFIVNLWLMVLSFRNRTFFFFFLLAEMFLIKSCIILLYFQNKGVVWNIQFVS